QLEYPAFAPRHPASGFPSGAPAGACTSLAELFPEVLPDVLSTRAVRPQWSSHRFPALPCWLSPACRLCSDYLCSESSQECLHRPLLRLPDCQHSALPHILHVPHYPSVGSSGLLDILLS